MPGGVVTVGAAVSTAEVEDDAIRDQHIAGRYRSSLQGWLGASFDPALVQGGVLVAAGYVYVARVDVPPGSVLTNALLAVSTAGGTLTADQNQAGIYLPDGTLIARTANQATTWASSGIKTMALTVEGGQSLTLSSSVSWVHVGLVANGSTAPTFARGGTTLINVLMNEGLAAFRFAASAAGGNTVLPTTRSVVGANGQSIWAGVS